MLHLTLKYYRMNRCFKQRLFWSRRCWFSFIWLLIFLYTASDSERCGAQVKFLCAPFITHARAASHSIRPWSTCHDPKLLHFGFNCCVTVCTSTFGIIGHCSTVYISYLISQISDQYCHHLFVKPLCCVAGWGADRWRLGGRVVAW